MNMLMQVRPILISMRRHKIAVMLLILEVALTMAVLGNLIFIVHEGVRRAHIPTGTMENDIGVIQSIGAIGEDNPGTAGSNLAVLRHVPGVVAAAYGSPPLWYVAQNSVFLDVSRQITAAHVYEFQGSQGLSETLGVRIIQGRNLEDNDLPLLNEIKNNTQFPALITQDLAKKLFPDGTVLGRLLYDSDNSIRIIGVVDHLRGQINNRAEDDESILVQYRVGEQNLGGGYMIRSLPGWLPRTLRAAAAALQKANPGHVQQKVFTLADLRRHYFETDLAVGHIMIAIMLILLVVTMLGIAGLVNFWVQQRSRQIAIRRALGATRRDIFLYFQMENFLIVSAGVLLGGLLAFAVNYFLMDRFEVPSLPFAYLLVGAIVLWLVGQLAVFGSARRAATINAP